MFLFIIVGMQ